MRTIDETDLKKSLEYYPLKMSEATIKRFNETFPEEPIDVEIERSIISLDMIGQSTKYIELQPREISEDESHIKDLYHDMLAGIRYESSPMLLVKDTSEEPLYNQLLMGQGNHRLSPAIALGYKEFFFDLIGIPMNDPKGMLAFMRLTNFLNDHGPQKTMKLQDTVKSYLQDKESGVLEWTGRADCEIEIRKRRPSCDPISIDKIVNSIEKQLGTYQAGIFRSLGSVSRQRAKVESGLPEDVIVAPSLHIKKYINDIVLGKLSKHETKERVVIAINSDKALTKKQLEKRRESVYRKIQQVYTNFDDIFKQTAKGKTKELKEEDLYPLTVNKNHPLHRLIIGGFLAQLNTEMNSRVIRTNAKGETIETLSGREAYNADTMIPIAKDTKNVVLNEIFDIEDTEIE